MEYSGKPPDFWMVSTEAPDPLVLRKCWRIKRLHDLVRDDYLLIKVDPPLNTLGLCTSEYADKAIIATRLEGMSLFPLSEGTLVVYVDAVCVPNIESTNRDYISVGDSKQVDWAALLPTEEEARKFMG